MREGKLTHQVNSKKAQSEEKQDTHLFFDKACVPFLKQYSDFR